jgi:hypothetical protein
MFCSLISNETCNELPYFSSFLYAFNGFDRS